MVRMRRVLAIPAVLAVAATALTGCGSNVKASVFITSLSFAIYVAARLTGPLLRDRRRRRNQGRPASPAGASKAKLAAR